MSNKFLSTNGTGGANLDDGTTPIFASTLGASSLTASTALKTNASGLLTSTDLDIADVTGLASDLVLKNELSFNEDDSHTPPSANQVKVYFKTDGQMYKQTPEGNESQIADLSSKVSKTGDTMSGNLSFSDGAGIVVGSGSIGGIVMNSNVITGLPDATSSSEPATKNQLDTKTTGPSSSTTLGVALFQGTTGKVLQDAGGNLTWDEDVFKLQTPTVQGKSGDLTLESNGGGVMTVGNTAVTLPDNNLVLSDGNIELNGATAILDIDDGTSRGVIRGYGSAYIDSASSRSYNYTTSADGVVHNLSNTAQSHDFKIFSTSKLTVNDATVESTVPVLVTDGTLALEPSASASATTGTSTEIFSDSGNNNNLTFVDNSIEYPIAGQQLITVKYSKRFAGNVAQTLYTDTNIEFLWDAANFQVQFKPLTYVSNYVDASILFVPGNANNTVKDQSGDIGFTNNSTYYFSDDGLIDTGFNMGNYGARQFLSVCPESFISSSSPCYRLDLMGGNTSNMNITIEKQSV